MSSYDIMSNLIQVYDNTNSTWDNLQVSSTNGQVLTVDSAEPLKLKWTTPVQGTVTQVNSGTGLQGGPITSTGTLSLTNTSIVPGTYSQVNATFDAQGRATFAENSLGSTFNKGNVALVGSTATITDANITPTSIFYLTYNAGVSYSPAKAGQLSYIASSGSCVINSNHAGDTNTVSYLVYY